MIAFEHPGPFIRRSILPKKMTVTTAAKQLGVSRPALSNLLNGKADLSSEMALRLEKAFGANKDALLELQAAYDASQVRAESSELPVRPYVAGFLEITATQISSWADQIASRSLLPVFLRRLVLTTGSALLKIDFPGYDNAQRHGWDGQVESAEPTPWVPKGASGWEFGCDQDAKRKAEGDYASRSAHVSAQERRQTTFIFVTPRNWPGKDTWAKEKRALKQWKDVRAYDASDLEQWLEQSVAAQSWMAERLGRASADIQSLEACWQDWASVTKPEMSKVLFAGAIETYRKKIKDWLEASPDAPLVVTADSVEEALAFLSCALTDAGDNQHPYYERTLVLRSGDALLKAVGASKDFLAVLASPDAQARSAGIHKSQHTIIFSHRGSIADPDISLELADDKTFEAGMAEMGFKHPDAGALSRECGQSLTILRRRLSQVPAIKSPPWAEDSALGRRLIPLMLAGVWDAQRSADQEVLSFLAGVDHTEVEKTVTELSGLEQSPLWSVGKYRGVVSKIDALYATHRLLTVPELEKFLERARIVLAEADPSLELAPDKRWMAAIYEKTRNHSSVLRRSICDTLILLAVHGNDLVRDRLGIDVEARVGGLVRDILTPIDAALLASQQDDLPYYAEAAPDVFLDILEADLQEPSPAVLSLMVPADSGIFGAGCPRTGLLWALELLAWKPEKMLRAVKILARLSEKKIDDNWVNKPEHSLKALFRSWMPQTAASLDHRSAALEAISKRFPDVAWRLCMAEFDPLNTIGQYSHRPRWRKDAAGFGQPLGRRDEVFPFKEKALHLAINWPKHSASTLGDLVHHVAQFPDAEQMAIWQAVQNWIASKPSDEDKAYLKDRIRRTIVTRPGKTQLPESSRAIAEKVQVLLEPLDVVVKHLWLFEKQWVEESLEDLEDEKFDYRKHEQNVADARRIALAEIWPAYGYEGVKRLCQAGESSQTVGWILADGILTSAEAIEFVTSLAAEDEDAKWADFCLAGFLHKYDPALRADLLVALEHRSRNEGNNGEDKLVRILKACPFNKATWDRVGRLPEAIHQKYWQQVYPQWQHQTPEELRELVESLLLVNRPRAAFHAVHFVTEQLETDILVQLLNEVATNASEPSGHYQLREHDVSAAFEVLDVRADVNRTDLARLEFAFLSALERSKRGIPNLQRELASSSLFFVQMLAVIYKRKDDGSDPPDWPSHQKVESDFATQAWRLLHAARRPPGTEEDGTVSAEKLKAWIVEVRELCKLHGRERAGDTAIGELLSKSPVGADGIWPIEAVRDVLEEVGTTNIAGGMTMGRYNARGAVWRAVGGGQERELAAQYRGWSDRLAFDSPFVSRMLEEMAKNYDREAQRHDLDNSLERRVLDR